MSDLFLGVDGGQSGTVAVLGTADGAIVALLAQGMSVCWVK